MTGPPVFALVPIEGLKGHERVEADKVEELVRELTRTQEFRDPVWVAHGSNVILNGHHRVAALQRLGAHWVPAWILDYEGAEVRVDRWGQGAPISKEEIVRRAAAGDLFPPKTTRHRLELDLPPRRVPLTTLMGPAEGSRVHPGAARVRSPPATAPPGRS